VEAVAAYGDHDLATLKGAEANGAEVPVVPLSWWRVGWLWRWRWRSRRHRGAKKIRIRDGGISESISWHITLRNHPRGICKDQCLINTSFRATWPRHWHARPEPDDQGGALITMDNSAEQGQASPSALKPPNRHPAVQTPPPIVAEGAIIQLADIRLCPQPVPFDGSSKRLHG
jgi:hypothetical protein